MLGSWEFNSVPDLQTCYFDQRPFQFPIQNVQFVGFFVVCLVCLFWFFLPWTSSETALRKFKKPCLMNMVSTGEVSVEILTCVCSDQNNLSVSSPLNICSSQSPSACRTVGGSQTVGEQQTQFVPAWRFSLLPLPPASLHAPSMQLSFHLLPSAVFFSQPC